MSVTFELLEFKLGLNPGSIYAVGKTGGSQVMVFVEHDSLPLHRGKGLPPLVARATLVEAPAPADFETDVAAVLEDPHEHDLHRLDDDGAPHS